MVATIDDHDPVSSDPAETGGCVKLSVVFTSDAPRSFGRRMERRQFVRLGRVLRVRPGGWIREGETTLKGRRGTLDDFENDNGYRTSGTTTNQLWTTVLRAFGYEDETFGFSTGELPSGPLPGLLG